MNGLLTALLFFFSDMFSTIVFAIILGATKDITYATIGGFIVGVLQLVFMRYRRMAIPAMQWMSLALVVVLGGATLFTQNPEFIKIKFSIDYFAIAAVMLKPGWMTRYMPPVVTENAPKIPLVFGFLWAGLLFAAGVINLIIALNYDNRTYVEFLSVFPIPSKIALFAAQYLATRILVGRKMKALALATAG